MDLKILLDHWWQVILILCTVGLVLKILGNDIIIFLKEFRKILKTLGRELSWNTKSNIGGTINIVMLMLSFILTLVLVSPSFLAQFGVIEDNNSGAWILGAVIFIVCLIGSPIFLIMFEREMNAFNDDE